MCICPRHDPEVFPNRNLHMTVKGGSNCRRTCNNSFRGISFLVDLEKIYSTHIP